MRVPLEYDLAGSRLRAIGPTGIDYDMMGSRVRRLGRITVDYDRLGSRPSTLKTDDEEPLTENEIISTFLVLDLARRAAADGGG